MRFTHVTFAAAILFGLATAQPSLAIVQFYQQFEKEYLANHPDKKYVEAVRKASDKCFVCHQGKKSKKNHNEFGKHLVGKLDRKKDMKDIDKIKAELAKALTMRIDPDDENSETYLDRLKASKWLGGELEDLKKEPKSDEKSVAGK